MVFEMVLQMVFVSNLLDQSEPKTKNLFIEYFLKN